jgi:two-component system, NtrC family, sensor kinase
MKVLVADDDEEMRLLLEDVVASCGHDVIVAVDGLDAWERFEHEKPPLAILDWDMPGLSGLDVCRRVRAGAEGSEAFVVVVTARDEAEDLRGVLDAGADDYFSKPISPEHLRARIVIAERRIAQDEARRRTEAALAKAQWLAGIGETSIALQHEINNPLAALLGHASLIEAGLCEPGEEAELLAVIIEQAHRIARVVKRLSALRNPESVEYIQGARMIDLGTKEE